MVMNIPAGLMLGIDARIRGAIPDSALGEVYRKPIVASFRPEIWSAIAEEAQRSRGPYTPGPWRTQGYVGAGIWVTDENSNNQIAVVYGLKTNERADSNARLIAAAPELLEAAKKLIEGAESEGWDCAR
jgi:hypothetical protein